jgi:hypothetical protein
MTATLAVNSNAPQLEGDGFDGQHNSYQNPGGGGGVGVALLHTTMKTEQKEPRGQRVQWVGRGGEGVESRTFGIKTVALKVT